MSNTRRHVACLVFGLCLITLAVNLQAPLYTTYTELSGYGAAATANVFSGYVLGVLPVLLVLGGLPDRIGRKPPIVVALLLSVVAILVMALWPHLEALGVTCLLLGVDTALASVTRTVYMSELMAGGDSRTSADRVTASTSLGPGLGAALTSLFLPFRESLVPGSFWVQLGLVCVALAAVAGLPDEAPRGRDMPMLRLPFSPAGNLPYDFLILLAWATVGLVVAILPSLLAAHGPARWLGFSTFTMISCGLLFQPLARRMAPASAICLRLVILPPNYALLAWGAIHGSLAAVLFGALGTNGPCYGFTYLGGLSAVDVPADAEKPRASAGYFLLAYLGFSPPVVFTGSIADCFGAPTALLFFGVSLTLAAAAVALSILRGVGCFRASASRVQGVTRDRGLGSPSQAGEQGRKLGEAADLRVRLFLPGPGPAVWIGPDSTHAGAARSGDIVAGVVVDMYHCRGLDAGVLQDFAERRRVGLADTQLLGAEGEPKVVSQAQAAHVGVTIGEHAEGKAVGEDLQGRVDFGKQNDPVAHFGEYLETDLGQAFRLHLWITGVEQGMEQDASAQLTETVAQHRFAIQQAGADRPRVPDGHRAQACRVTRQPFTEQGLGVVHHRGDVPQGVVEVESDQSQAAHGSLPPSALPLRLARGWARS